MPRKELAGWKQRRNPRTQQRGEDGWGDLECIMRQTCRSGAEGRPGKRGDGMWGKLGFASPPQLTIFPPLAPTDAPDGQEAAYQRRLETLRSAPISAISRSLFPSARSCPTSEAETLHPASGFCPEDTAPPRFFFFFRVKSHRGDVCRRAAHR